MVVLEIRDEELCFPLHRRVISELLLSFSSCKDQPGDTLPISIVQKSKLHPAQPGLSSFCVYGSAWKSLEGILFNWVLNPHCLLPRGSVLHSPYRGSICSHASFYSRSVLFCNWALVSTITNTCILMTMLIITLIMISFSTCVSLMHFKMFSFYFTWILVEKSTSKEQSDTYTTAENSANHSGYLDFQQEITSGRNWNKIQQMTDSSFSFRGTFCYSSQPGTLNHRERFPLGVGRRLEAWKREVTKGSHKPSFISVLFIVLPNFLRPMRPQEK